MHMIVAMSPTEFFELIAKVFVFWAPRSFGNVIFFDCHGACMLGHYLWQHCVVDSLRSNL